MNTNQETILQLWPKYLAGTCSRAEMDQLFEALQKESPGGETELRMQEVEQSLSDAWEGNHTPPVLQMPPDWKQLWENIAAATVSKRKRLRKIYTISAAAASVLLIAAVYMFYLQGNTKSVIAKNIPAAPEKIITTSGQHVQVLDDGTRVILKGSARLTVVAFNEQERVVRLENGDAFFDVKHESNRPFTVKTSSVNVRVLGTAFLVAEKADGRIEVTVTRGKVRVSNQKQEVLGTITPRQSLFYNEPVNQVIINREVDTTGIAMPKNITEWKWKDARLGEVIGWLNQHYHVNIILSNQSLSDSYFSASFKETVSLEDVLDVIKQLYHLKTVSRNDGTIELLPDTY